jgi:hypothetical protein
MAGTEATTDPPTLDTSAQPLVITLFGPQELTGAPAQYGERLARLCRALLGYRRGAEVPGRAALAGGGLQGTARVYLHGRPLAFTLDERLLRLLEPASTPDRGVGIAQARIREEQVPYSALPREDGQEVRAAGEVFDSSLERRLAEEFATLERERATAGWRLEREPEPVLAGATILVPDFALRRGARRVFLEIAGYWRPGYRERKLRKLTALGGKVPLILAVPESARADFAALPASIAPLWYQEYLSARALVELLEREYNDFTTRLAALDTEAVCAEVARSGRIPSVESYALLRCYTRSEVTQTVALLAANAAEAPLWVEGVGLCSPAWYSKLLTDLRDLVAWMPDAHMPLAALAARVRAAWPDLCDVTDATVEALAPRAGLRVSRSSLFEADVTLAEATSQQLEGQLDATHPRSGMSGSERVRTAQPRRNAKRKQTGPSYTTASIFADDSLEESSR